VFEDRIEIENPGTLVPGLTFDDLYDGVSRLRNRVIGRVFRDLGLVEQWGSGVARMLDACRAAGLPDPELREVGFRFRVTFRASRQGAAQLDVRDQAILDTLAESEGLTTSQVAGVIDRTTRATRTRLRELVELGLVVEVGSSPNDPRRRYFVAEDPGAYVDRR
jgi:predicted HTH transcriptional regulator